MALDVSFFVVLITIFRLFYVCMWIVHVVVVMFSNSNYCGKKRLDL